MSRLVLVVRQPRTQLQEALCARTWELGKLLDEIDCTVLEEQDSNNADWQSATHTWRAKATAPAVLAPHMDSNYLAWTATVEWSNERFQSRWQVEPHAVKKSLVCSAEVNMADALRGRGTRLSIDFNIEGLDGRLGIKTLANQVVSVNWRKLVDAAVKSIESGKS